MEETQEDLCATVLRSSYRNCRPSAYRIDVDVEKQQTRVGRVHPYHIRNV